VYNPAETKLMRQARTANCQAFNGLGMLLRQGAQAFERWTGVMPDLAVMRQAVNG
jgi:shikimate dehydrogenase